jgi:FdhE protein
LTLDAWVAKHPYLQPVADLHSQVGAVADGLSISRARIPVWDDYVKDFHAGVPLLNSSHVSIDLGSVETAVRSMVEKLVSRPLPGRFAVESRDLSVELHRHPDSPRRAVSWLIDQKSFTPSCPGLLYYLGWTLMARYLCPIVAAFGSWRDEEHWLREYCPTCGALPSMAQLAGVDPGRLRLLSCGRCRTRWRYRRTGCPFCEVEDDHQLRALAIEGENGLRLDYCDACTAYLKTYNGEGSEMVMLSDWTSLHLDVIAHDRGLKRLAASLYAM